jgi:glycosyltransferase involved in cell wall biosynthesis
MAEQTLRVCPEIKNLSITPFGIDIKRFKPMAGLRSPDTLTIGTVKKLESKYGIDILLRAFAALRDRIERDLPSLRLLIVGGGPDEAQLRDLATELGVGDEAIFASAVPHAEVPSHLNRLDVYVALSRSESFGVAVLEASACGLPVVVSDAGGLPEVVQDGITGFVVEREDPAAAADTLQKLLTNADLRQRMGRAGRQHVIKNYEWSASVDHMEEVYAKVLGKSRARIAR